MGSEDQVHETQSTSSVDISHKTPTSRNMFGRQMLIAEMRSTWAVQNPNYPVSLTRSCCRIAETCTNCTARLLTYKFLKDHHGLYALLFARGLKQKRLAATLGLEDELRHHAATRPMVRAGREMVRRTWSQLVSEACLVTEEHGSLPPAQWFQKNGHGSLVQAVYYLGYTWDQLRDAVGDPSTGAFVESRNGIRWRSHPEASFSNFLYARGIQHRRGDRYPKKYEELSAKPMAAMTFTS